MNGYSYNGGYDGEHVDNAGERAADDELMGMGAQGGMHTNAFGGQSLDEIVNQNAKAIRRQSLPQQYGGSPHPMDPNLRRISMMEYGDSSPASSMGNFSYEASNGLEQGPMLANPSMATANQRQRGHAQRGDSHNELAVNTAFANSHAYNNLMSSASYHSPAHPQSGFDVAMDSPYLDHGLGMQMDYNSDQSLVGGGATGSISHVSPYRQAQFHQGLATSPMPQGGSQGTPQSSHGQSHGSGGVSGMNTQYSAQSNSTNTARQSSRHSMQNPDNVSNQMHHSGTNSINQTTNSSPAHGYGHSGFVGQPQHPQPGTQQDRGMGDSSQAFDGVNGPLPVDPSKYNPNNQGFNWEAQKGGWPSTMVKRPHMNTSYKNAYSSTGFDMLGVLVSVLRHGDCLMTTDFAQMRVATRPNPDINIGPVDLSCAFVVCDAEKDDFPIVYCSDNFERLTGYTKHMILGRNCRFLQSPDGNVAPGVRRKYVDDDSVLYLKNMINLRREAQISLINYRRGGQPFMNLLTMIPIPWDSDQVKFFVGFQVDLVEQPNAVTNKNPGTSSVGQVVVWEAPD